MDTIVILDFGSQYTQLIARRLREMQVYAVIYPYNAPNLPTENVKGYILSGGPASVTNSNSPQRSIDEWVGKVPILGICYGAQYIAYINGGKVVPAQHREYGQAKLHLNHPSELWRNVHEGEIWMSHGDTITELPLGFTPIGRTEDIAFAAFEAVDSLLYGLQFHPEVSHTQFGFQILHNFVFEICRAKPEWTPAAFIETSIETIRNQVGNSKVLCALSGGVDSTVAATLVHKAIGEQLICVFVNNGLLRLNEYEEVLACYQELGLNCVGVDASEQFLTELSGVEEPETKRKIIGRIFIEVFEKAAHNFSDVKYLVQGTIYPDVIESVSVLGPSVTIKSHHNVGGLPAKMQLKLLEPLRLLFKDEVRKIGLGLNIPAHIIGRHPFPGPGLAIRIPGAITPERLSILKAADAIFIQALKDAGLYAQVWQAFAVLLPVASVGVMGDERTYENVLALRAVTSVDGMTADWAQLPFSFLAEVSNKIINRVKGINRVVYDISSKPPATIEWE